MDIEHASDMYAPRAVVEEESRRAKDKADMRAMVMRLGR